MTPKEHRDTAEAAFLIGSVESANYHASMGILEALLEMEYCEQHKVRGLCSYCFHVILAEMISAATVRLR
jgi:hypothetical protein